MEGETQRLRRWGWGWREADRPGEKDRERERQTYRDRVGETILTHTDRKIDKD